MTARVSAENSLRLSILLATDTYETLRPVIQSLRRQIDREHLEIVIIAPGESLGLINSSQLDGFGAVRVVAVSKPLSLPRARAAGVRAASTPIVFVGETHCFPEPDMCNRLLAGFKDEHCVAVVPAIVNAESEDGAELGVLPDGLQRVGARTYVWSTRAAAQVQRRVSAGCVARTRRSPRRPARCLQRGALANSPSAGLLLLLRSRRARQSRERNETAGHASNSVL